VCGIAGWYNRNGTPVDSRILKRMSQIMIHRGPDDHAIWVDGHIGLAHQRLSIRDLSAAGRQPMADTARRIYVTFNGEIYNDKILREELSRDFGFKFHSTCDTEILPYAYLAWGEQMFPRLEGMFSIGLWDIANDRLLLARDGIGIKPVFFAEVDGTVLFASEVKSILANPIVTPKLDPRGLHTFLAAGHAGPASSLLKGVRQVAPGTVVTFSRSATREWCFWQPSRNGDITDMGQALELLESTLEEVVNDQLISDVPLSVLQSGGIDSSLISLAVGRRRAKPPLFTASFNEPSHDEVDLARSLAQAAGLPHHVISADAPSADLGDAFRATVFHFDGQCADTGALGFYFLAQAVRKHSTVVLSGDGGDEFFCGYETYAATRVAEILRRVTPRGAARQMGRLAYQLDPANESRLRTAAVVARFANGLGEGGARPHLEWRRLLPAFLAPQVYGREMAELAGISPYPEYAAYYDGASGGALDRAMLADQRFHIQSVLAKVDAMSMAHSLEVRVPLLDRRIMDLAGRLHLSLLNPLKGPPKHALRELAKKMGAPHALTSARKKGFNVPIARLLRRELRDLAEQVLVRDVDVLEPYLNPDAVRGLWRAHRDVQADHAFAIWPILTLAVWRAGLAKADGEPPAQRPAIASRADSALAGA
jgi:asparagine synthase (glutamine-hydrolysing)